MEQTDNSDYKYHIEESKPDNEELFVASNDPSILVASDAVRNDNVNDEPNQGTLQPDPTAMHRTIPSIDVSDLALDDPSKNNTTSDQPSSNNFVFDTKYPEQVNSETRLATVLCHAGSRLPATVSDTTLVPSLMGSEVTSIIEESELSVRKIINTVLDKVFEEINLKCEKGPHYVSPIEDPYNKAWKYLAKHNILGLFQGITSGIVYEKPSDPLMYMINEIERLQELDRQKKGVIRQSSSTILDEEEEEMIDAE